MTAASPTHGRATDLVAAAISGADAAESWFWRCEAPTVLVALAIYGAWILLLAFHTMLPWWVLLLLGGYVVQWHFSLQHEAIHSWRTLPTWLRTAIVWPPLGVWFPFELYRESHSLHHRNTHLTFPGEDTETLYHTAASWRRYGALRRGMLLANQTFLGRLLLGPLVRPPRLWLIEIRRILAGDFVHAGIWLRHGVGVAALFVLIDDGFDMPIWQYLLVFAYPGTALGMMRSFIEHRWGERPSQRTAIVESNAVFGLLFLWNNLHAIHHTFPTLSWYRLPKVWREHRTRMLAHNGGYVFKGYGEIARRWLVRPVFVPIHPPSLAAERMGAGQRGS